MSCLIRLKNVTFRFPERERPTLHHLDFTLGAEDHIGIVGPNGAGKTTLLNVIMGLTIPNSGTVEIFHKERKTARDFQEIRPRLGFVFQNADDQLFCPTVLDDVAFGPLNLGLDRDEAAARARQTLAQLGLEGYEERVPYRLSGGEKRLVALAGVLAMKPDALILDEPTTGLSPEARHRLIHILQDLPQPRLVVSHDLEFLTEVTDSIKAMRDGQVTEGELQPHTHVHVHMEGDIPHDH